MNYRPNYFVSISFDDDYDDDNDDADEDDDDNNIRANEE